MKRKTVLLAALLCFCTLLPGCSPQPEADWEEVHNTWAEATSAFRSGQPAVFRDADFLGFVTDVNEWELTAEIIYREQDGPTVMFSTEEDPVTQVALDTAAIFIVNASGGEQAVVPGSLKDINVTDAVSILGEYNQDRLIASSITVWRIM